MCIYIQRVRMLLMMMTTLIPLFSFFSWNSAFTFLQMHLHSWFLAEKQK